MQEYMIEMKCDPPQPPIIRRRPQRRDDVIEENKEENKEEVDNDDIYVEIDEKEENSSILIVDDDIINLEVHEAMIHQMKHIKSDTALSGPIAIELIKERLEKVLEGQATMYKFILMDYSMPEMDGPQTAE